MLEQYQVGEKDCGTELTVPGSWFDWRTAREANDNKDKIFAITITAYDSHHKKTERSKPELMVQFKEDASLNGVVFALLPVPPWICCKRASLAPAVHHWAGTHNPQAGKHVIEAPGYEV